MTCAYRIASTVTVLVVALTVAPVSARAQTPARPGTPPQGQGQERRRYIIEFDRSGPEAAAIKAAGGELIHQFPRFRAAAAWLPEAALRALQNHPNVVRIEEDPQRFLLAETVPYGITMVQADQVSNSPTSDRKVCIIDTGYSLGHPDLPDSSGVSGVSDSGTGSWFQDGCGHGTHVAGTIAALANAQGVRGVVAGGPINLHIVKVFDSSCTWAYSSSLIAALDQCRAAGAQVVNMSLGGPVSSTLERLAFDDAYSAGVLSVAAAGNAGDTSISYPAGYGSVVSVAAVNSNKALAGFSQRNADVELAAPGVGVLSTVPWVEANTATVDTVVYSGTYLQDAGRTGIAGVSGLLANGGLCDQMGAWSGKVVLCQRGTINFYDKVINVQNSGGIAAIIYNNLPGGFLGLLGTPSVIPAIGITQAEGQFLVANKIGQSGTVVSYRDDTGGGYEAWDGTSMATPHVAGVAALVWGHLPWKTNAEVRAALTASAEDLGTAGRDTSFGFGLVRANAALNALTNGTPPPPPPPSNLLLTVKTRGKKFADLSWSGATTSTVDIYRNDVSIASGTANDGSYSDTVSGKGSYTYRVCQAGSAVACSPSVTVVF